MTPTKNRFSSRLAQTALILIAIGVLGLAAGFMRNMFHVNNERVLKAEMHLQRTQRNLERFVKLTNSVGKVTQLIGISNSSASQTIHAAGSKLVNRSILENANAQIDLKIAEMGEHLVAVADCCIERYTDFNRAQEGFATLNLAGIEDVLIRSSGKSVADRDSPLYELFVPHDLATNAITALQGSKICELSRFNDVTKAFEITSALKAHNIQSALRPVKTTGQENTAERLYILYVRCADEESARRSVNGSANANVEEF